ncbi:MAG: SDR family NAD(P)-dependent oxidoreductase [Leucobacter sp.]
MNESSSKQHTALITGASSGLGAEYARQLAARGSSLVLVARDDVALEALAGVLREAHGVQIEVLATDLLDAEGVARVSARLENREQPVDMLINNAGFGLSLDFAENDVESEVQHLRIHNEVPLRLMHASLSGMLERGRGRIVNVASVAAFIPRSTYSASKQWLVRFSTWANARYRSQGVTVTAVCPGFTHTNFHERLGLPPGHEGVPRWMWLDAPRVVNDSLRDIQRGKSVSIPSKRYKVLAGIAKIVPSTVLARAGERGR